MFLVLLSLGSLLGLQAPAQAPPPPDPAPQALGSRVIVEIPAGATVIEEKGLPADASLNAAPSQVERAGPAGRGSPDPMDRAPRGLRLYQFVLAPRETLRLDLKAFPANRIVMSFAPPVQPEEVSPGIKRANQTPPLVRMSRIELMNPATAPQPVVLRLVGSTEVPYRLEIRRR